MTSFPSTAFSAAQSKWIAKRCIVYPSVKRVLNNWELIKQKRVLDVGCGTGKSPQLVVGLDSSKEMIEIAKNTFRDKGHQFLHCSILNADLRGFDVAVAFFALDFLENRQQLTKAIQNIFNSLKSDGVLVAGVPNGVKNFNPVKEEGQKLGVAINLDSDANLYDGRRLRVEFSITEVCESSSTAM
ncbi:methyltransferase domain protein [Oesophagostomum dentatum]|uniref:Methyltransferase domain protein n=1 Tax=Oesophagostomum dentatum TaxID=61180 RepID=A0A0B1TMU3_OESDE|nr:methyltransferase domain protein [Oesophagostomum dentatum]